MTHRYERALIGALTLATVVGAYTAFSNLSSTNHVLVPPTQDIARELWTGFAHEGFASDVKISVIRVLLGFAIGSSAGVVLGAFMGWFRDIGYFCDPVIEAARPIPPLAYIPLIILWFGIGEDARILVIALAAFLTTVITAYAGMKEVPNVYVDAARTLGANRFQVFTSIAIPAASPYIFAGLRIALAGCWTTLVAAELIAARDGLGFLLENGRTFLETDLVMAGILIIGVVAYGMDRILRAAQRYATQWTETRG